MLSFTPFSPFLVSAPALACVCLAGAQEWEGVPVPSLVCLFLNQGILCVYVSGKTVHIQEYSSSQKLEISRNSKPLFPAGMTSF